MDTLGIEPRASRMLSGCDTTTPCAPYERDMAVTLQRKPGHNKNRTRDVKHMFVHSNMSAVGFEPTRSCLQWILSPPP